MRLAEFDYALPEDRIAQHPTSPRDAAKLLVVDRETGRFAHRIFRDLPEYLRPEDVLVVNNTRVIPARLRARKPTGGAIEVVLLRPAPSAPGPRPSVPADDVWEVLLRPGRRAQVGTRLLFSDQLTGEVVSGAPGGTPVVRFSGSRRVLDVARAIGEMPIPPCTAWMRSGMRSLMRPLQHSARCGAVAALWLWEPQLCERWKRWPPCTEGSAPDAG